MINIDYNYNMLKEMHCFIIEENPEDTKDTRQLLLNIMN